MPCLAYNEIVLVWLISAMQPLSRTETGNDFDFRHLTETDLRAFKALRLEALKEIIVPSIGKFVAGVQPEFVPLKI